MGGSSSGFSPASSAVALIPAVTAQAKPAAAATMGGSDGTAVGQDALNLQKRRQVTDGRSAVTQDLTVPTSIVSSGAGVSIPNSGV